MSEEITTRLLKMVTDISEAVNRTAQDVAVMKAQQAERKESQAKAINGNWNKYLVKRVWFP